VSERESESHSAERSAETLTFTAQCSL